MRLSSEVRGRKRARSIKLRFQEARIIQAGMGVGVSSWALANKTARRDGVIGTVSGVVAEDIVVRTLQKGDPGEHMRRALSNFPFPEVGKQIVDKFYVPGGIPEGKRFRGYPVFDLEPSPELQKLMIASNFAIVWLAKEGHDGLISVNYLEKIQMTHIYYLYGAMLAGVHIVTMGAGIIKQVPGLLDTIAAGGNPSYRVSVEDAPADEPDKAKQVASFNPQELFGQDIPPMKRPLLLAIVSSGTLAESLLKTNGIDGFVIEGPTAGGHNPPPRGKVALDELGQPIYGERDKVDLSKFREFREKFGISFWLAGSYASPEGLKKALSEGANGVQCGSLFALCNDSGMLDNLRRKARGLGYHGKLEVRTTLRSPTGYPFKVAMIPGTLSDDLVYKDRERACSICSLRVPYWRKDKPEKIGYRCSSEPIELFQKKSVDPGKAKEEAEYKLCLCNALLATVGLGNPGERPVVTMGDDVSFLPHLMKDEDDSYTADDAIDWLIAA